MRRLRPTRSCTVAACLSIILGLGIGATGLAQDPELTQRLFTAVHKNDLAGVQIAVADGADIRARNRLGLTALDLAVDKGHFEIAHYLISVRDIRARTEADAGGPEPTRPQSSPPPVVPPAAQADSAPQPPADPPAPTAWPQSVPNPFEANAVPPGARHPVVGESPSPGMPALPPGVAAEGETEPSGLQPQAGEFVAPLPRASGLPGPAMPPPYRPGVERSADPLSSPIPPRFETPPPKPEPRDDAAEASEKGAGQAPSADNSVRLAPTLALSDAVEPTDAPRGQDHGFEERDVEASPGTWRDQVWQLGTQIVAQLGNAIDGSWLEPSESPILVLVDLPPRLSPIGAAHAGELGNEQGTPEPNISQPDPRRKAAFLEPELSDAVREAVELRPASGSAEVQGEIADVRSNPPDAVAHQQIVPDGEGSLAVRFAVSPPKPLRSKTRVRATTDSLAEEELPPAVPAEASKDAELTGAVKIAEDDDRSPVSYDPYDPTVSIAYAEPSNPFAAEAIAPGARHPEIGETPRVLPPPPRVRFVRANRDEPSVPLAQLGASGGWGTPEKPLPDGSIEGSDIADVAAAPGEQLAQAASGDRAAADAGVDPPGASDTGPFVPLGPAPGDANYVMVPPAPANLSDRVLSIGDALRLGGEMPPEPKGSDDPRRCVLKQRGAVHFCVEPVDWPPDLLSRLGISTIMYQGAGAIVRYDEGRTSRIHVVFPTEEFEAVVTYYRSRFGEPTEVVERQISPFAKPRRANVTVVWRRQDPEAERQVTLEIRNFDDARGGFPDLRHGAILLYDEASPPIFPVLSPLDLMPTRRR